MALRFIGKDPESADGDSPTVWVDDADGSIVIQAGSSTRARARRLATCPRTRPWCGCPAGWFRS